MIQCNDLTKTYVNGQTLTHALNQVSLTIKNGDFVVVLGPSGSGKSTLLNVLSGLDQPTTGDILIDEHPITNMDQKALTHFRRNHLGFIFQAYNLLPTLTVYENVELGYHLGSKRISVDQMLSDVGMLDHKDKMPYELSGGEQQRVSIARALIKEPKILFCDEPTGALDEKTGKRVLSLLQTLNKKYQTTIILITHNPAISKLAHKVIKMNSGHIVEEKENKEQMDALEIHWSS